MASDYAAIRDENVLGYGTYIDRIGPILLSERYADRTHFIYEILQNAEDALSRRDAWQGSRSVAFQLSGDALRIRHFGVPFDEADVRGICGIGESTKDLTAIGRFGIGFNPCTRSPTDQKFIPARKASPSIATCGRWAYSQPSAMTTKRSFCFR